MVDFRFMTERQQKKYKEVVRTFPNLLGNKEFMHYITETSIEGDFIVSIKEENDIIGFSGFNGFERCPYHVEFTFYRDKSFRVKSTERIDPGNSYIKYMQHISINKMARHDKNGRLIYMHCEKQIECKKQQVNQDSLVDEKRSGIEINEIIYINNGKYFEVSTDIKGKTRYFILGDSTPKSGIREEAFISFGEKYCKLYQKNKKV